MKKLCKQLLVFSLALWLLAAGTVRAAEDASMAANFQQGDQYYGFAALDQWPSGLRGELRSSGLALPLQLGPVRLTDSGLPAAYLLLVDRSGSMKDVGGWVTRFISALEETDNARFLLATFGEEFSLEWNGLAEDGSAAKAAEEIAYTVRKTDLSQGILDAVDYLKSVQREPGELLNLVVITDGIPDKSEDSPALSEVARQLAEDSSILVHTFGLRVDEPGSQEALENLETLGRGAHLVGNEKRSARAMGKELAEFVNDLCVVSFPWSAQSAGSMELLLSWESEGELVIPLDMSSVPVLTKPETDGGEAGEEEIPAPPEGPDTSAPDDGGETPGQTGETTGPEDLDLPDDPGDSGLSEETENPPTGKKTGFGWAVWAAAGGAALLLLALLLLLLLRRRRRLPVKPSKGSVFMRLEVISGVYAGPNELYLENELIVGRGRRCDIPWKDKEVASRNSRIFLRDNIVYIEDLNSPHGTALGGMRLYSPNRLRSGDEISAGPVRFRLKF